MRAILPHVAGFGSGAFLGFCIGYAIKKITRFAIFILGGLAVVIFILQYYGYLDLHVEKTLQTYDQIMPSFMRVLKNFFDFITSKLPATAIGFTLGAILGLKQG